jgi:DNA-binding response OmpR family regulator
MSRMMNHWVLYQDQLEMEGYEVTHSPTGRIGGLSSEGDFELCLLDVMLPQMDGFELAEKIRGVSSMCPLF